MNLASADAGPRGGEHMTEEQAEKILHELRSIKVAVWTAILLAVFIFTSLKIIEAIVGPAPPPTVSVQPRK